MRKAAVKQLSVCFQFPYKHTTRTYARLLISHIYPKSAHKKLHSVINQMKRLLVLIGNQMLVSDYHSKHDNRQEAIST